MNMTDKERGQNIQSHILPSTIAVVDKRTSLHCYYVKMCRTGEYACDTYSTHFYIIAGKGCSFVYLRNCIFCPLSLSVMFIVYSGGGVDSEGVKCRVGVVSTGGGGGSDGDGICGVCCGVSGLLLVTVVFWWCGDGVSGGGGDCGGCGDWGGDGASRVGGLDVLKSVVVVVFAVLLVVSVVTGFRRCCLCWW